MRVWLREEGKPSDARRREGGQMRDRSSRAGNGCMETERANRGPCFTNCHLRWANGGGPYNNYRWAADCTQQAMYSATSKQCIMHTWVITALPSNTISQTRVDQNPRYTDSRFMGNWRRALIFVSVLITTSHWSPLVTDPETYHLSALTYKTVVNERRLSSSNL